VREGYDKNARFVSDLGMPVVELLNAKSGERILILGAAMACSPRSCRTVDVK